MLLSVFLAACQAGEVRHGGVAPPEWVVKEPRMKGMICAVGMSEPTYYRDEAKDNAAGQARAELARALSVQIESIMVDITSDRGTEIDEATVMQVSSWTSSLVLENSEPRGYWYDAEGIVAGRRGVTFALVCMPRKLDRKSIEAGLAGTEMFSGAPPEEIGRNAEEIIRIIEEER